MRSFPYCQYQKCNALRPVDWRWRRAQRLIEGGRYASRQRDDAVTCRAVHFLRALRRAHSRRARLGLARSKPHLYAAHQVHIGPWQRRVEVEARLLARQTPEVIAAAVGATTEDITAFHDLFFDVSDRIMAAEYITKAAVWKGTRAGSRDHAAEAFVRELGYFGGTVVLDTVLQLFNGSTAGDGQPTEIAASPFQLYENARRLLDLYAELTSEEHSSRSPQQDPPSKLADRLADSAEGDQKAEELVKWGAHRADERPFGATGLTDAAAGTIAREVMELLSCEVG